MNHASKLSRSRVAEEKKYQMKTKEFCIECNPSSRVTDFLLRDREEYDEKRVLTYYFNTAYKVFLNRLFRFKELSRQINKEEQKELLGMLTELTEAQRLIYEVKDEKSEGKNKPLRQSF